MDHRHTVHSIEELHQLPAADVTEIDIKRPGVHLDDRIARKLQRFPHLERLNVSDAYVRKSFVGNLPPTIQAIFTNCSMKVCVPSKPQKNQADDVLCMKRPSRMIEKIENLSSLDNSVRRLFLTRPNGVIDGNVAKKLNAFPILERLDIVNAMVDLTFLDVLLPNI
ncbi:uncharacterized protein LOC117110891, partial [Anneissia japonica]|uniref:uncharacterized protein LOC117110891 n=1 Tax=Anneissia japonica TaxID=1529436 RepID=UPI0014257155